MQLLLHTHDSRNDTGLLRNAIFHYADPDTLVSRKKVSGNGKAYNWIMFVGFVGLLAYGILMKSFAIIFLNSLFTFTSVIIFNLLFE